MNSRAHSFEDLKLIIEQCQINSKKLTCLRYLKLQQLWAHIFFERSVPCVFEGQSDLTDQTKKQKRQGQELKAMCL